MPASQTVRLRLLCVAAVLLLVSVGAAQAGRVAIGVNIGFPHYGAHVGYGPGYHGHGRGHVYARPYYRGYYGGYYGGYAGYGGWGPAVVWAPPPVYGAPAAPVVVVERQPAPAAPSRPDPVIYPRNGQNGQQTEYDRQECNRWATTQPAAVADASVFHRAVEACMDGRGYSMR